MEEFLNENLLNCCSKTTFEKRLKRLMNKHIRQFHDSRARDEDNIDIQDELKDKNDDAINVYASYMREIISAFVFYSKPNIEIDVVMPSIKESTEKIIKMTKFFVQVTKLNQKQKCVYFKRI